MGNTSRDSFGRLGSFVRARRLRNRILFGHRPRRIHLAHRLGAEIRLFQSKRLLAHHKVGLSISRGRVLSSLRRRTGRSRRSSGVTLVILGNSTHPSQSVLSLESATHSLRRLHQHLSQPLVSNYGKVGHHSHFSHNCSLSLLQLLLDVLSACDLPSPVVLYREESDVLLWRDFLTTHVRKGKPGAAMPAFVRIQHGREAAEAEFDMM